MKRFVVVVVALFLCALAEAQKPTTGPGTCRANLTIDEFLLPDDAAAAKLAFITLRSALLKGDRTQVFSLMSFPADFVIDGYPVKFNNARELSEKYNKVFTDYVIRSVRQQEPDELVGGWDGVSLSNGAVRLTRNESGAFLVSNVSPKPVKLPDSLADFLERRPTCPPIVVEGQIAAYNWVSHTFPGFEGIYIDHLVVDVTQVVSGRLSAKRIRVDFWGVGQLAEYNLPPRTFEPGFTWRMYLRPSNEPPANDEVCGKDVQESIASVDEAGHEVARDSAIKVLSGEGTPSYSGLPCFEARKQFFNLVPAQAAKH